jgi:hypothetical protein
MAYTAEFAAYRLGQIDEKLAPLIEIMGREPINLVHGLFTLNKVSS